ncbi:uncharacterized protein MELLADRAFT_66711 [Melampsora larici-populina 98AG31]|uniref:Uncharacterized protein n=1 Tax=Melampsora larici-populina (strain 98AG31 / pathotype 3-4-7) TaxID=747676 RepID=F4S0A2_MELLP|nr:uncharacterized protein MELLADRAFT_66711 [Melampsora larici-populina 98AG31]EGG01928.1 hypothetical protein MELLADRAFT_66711 [Melampsora larici-populina 98AG31]
MNTLNLLIVPDADCMDLATNCCYHLRGPVTPGFAGQDTIFYPTARSAIAVISHAPNGTNPTSRSTVVSRGRVIQCRNQRNQSRWWVNIMHTVYNQELRRYTNLEIDHYLSRAVMREVGRDNFLPDGDRWAITVLQVVEIDPVVPGDFDDFWLLI